MDIAGKIGNTMQFLQTDIWRIRIEDLHGPRRFLIRYLRILLVAYKEFIKDNCTQWASSLTYFSLLSIVPVFALAFAVAKGFNLQQHLEQLILEQLAGQEEVTTRLIMYSRNLLENTKGEVLAGVGAIFLIWSVFRILETTEMSFNSIWEIEQSRSLGRKLSDYLSIMLIGPVLLIISSSAMVVLATRINEILDMLGILGVLSPVIKLLIRIIPIVLIWFLLTFMYVFIPNTKVKMGSGFIASVVAGTVFVIVQWIYITFQIGVAKYNAIYGSFAALPLFLFWLNTSWLIVLFGAEITDAHQHENLYLYDPDAKKVSRSFRRLLSLQVMHLLVKNFKEGGAPLNGLKISESLDIPQQIVREILQELSGCSLIIAIPEEHKEMKSYQPSRDIDFFTLSYVINALEEKGVDTIPVAQTESLQRISKSLKTFKDQIEKSEANVRLKDIR